MRQSGRLLQHLWLETNGFKRHLTRNLLKHAEVPDLDATQSLLIDDLTITVAENIDPGFLQLLLAHCPMTDTMPLTDLLLRKIGRQPQFHDTILIACQHLMASTVTQFGYLNRLGIPWKNMYVMGKPYSTHRAAVAVLRQRGAYVHPAIEQFPTSGARGLRTYETVMTDAANDLIVRVHDRLGKARAPKRVLILDDGAVLISVLAEKRGLESEEVVAVEQTTGGISRLAKTDLPFPVVDIADSAAKVGCEAKFIGESIVAETNERLRRLRGDVNWGHEHVLLIGFGAVGSWVAKSLTSAHKLGSLVIFDRANRKASMVMAAEYDATFNLRQAVREATVIIGCTGGRAFPQAFDTEVRDDAILLSGSSGTVEFNGLLSVEARRYSKMNRPLGAEFDTPFSRIHDDYQVSNKHGRFWITNGGFPVNFSGAPDPIAFDDIQITRTFMVAGAVQANRLFGRGVAMQGFDEGFDQCIIETFTEMRAKPTPRGQKKTATVAS